MLKLTQICDNLGKKRVSVKDVVLPLILRAIDDEEDPLLARKAQRWLKLPIEEAFKDAGLG